jgi:hypothetical protein
MLLPGEFFMKPLRIYALVSASIAALGTVTLAALTTPLQPVIADTPKGNVTQVKALYSEKCSACHNLPVPEEKGYTREEWQRTVNTMLTKYHASDSIAPNEAAQIVDYLATFAPKAAVRNRGGQPSDPWATDSTDVWTETPSATRVFNFENGSLAGLSSLGSGAAGPVPVCSVASDHAGADGTVAHVSGPNFRPDRFALLLDRTDSGRDVDVRVRFRIDLGKLSPAVGIVFGVADPSHYWVLRCHQSQGTLALIQITGQTHTTLQQTAIVLPVPSTPLTPTTTPIGPGWHMLRLLVRDGQVRGWVDMQKRISMAVPNYTGGKVGIWTQGNTSASFDDWTVDWYDAPLVAPAPLS